MALDWTPLWYGLGSCPLPKPWSPASCWSATSLKKVRVSFCCMWPKTLMHQVSHPLPFHLVLEKGPIAMPLIPKLLYANYSRMYFFIALLTCFLGTSNSLNPQTHSLCPFPSSMLFFSSYYPCDWNHSSPSYGPETCKPLDIFPFTDCQCDFKPWAFWHTWREWASKGGSSNRSPIEFLKNYDYRQHILGKVFLGSAEHTVLISCWSFSSIITVSSYESCDDS